MVCSRKEHHTDTNWPCSHAPITASSTPGCTSGSTAPWDNARLREAATSPAHQRSIASPGLYGRQWPAIIIIIIIMGKSMACGAVEGPAADTSLQQQSGDRWHKAHHPIGAHEGDVAEVWVDSDGHLSGSVGTRLSLLLSRCQVVWHRASCRNRAHHHGWILESGREGHAESERETACQ